MLAQHMERMIELRMQEKEWARKRDRGEISDEDFYDKLRDIRKERDKVTSGHDEL